MFSMKELLKKIFGNKRDDSRLFKLEKAVRVGQNTSIGDYTFIGENTNLGDNCASIGRYCSIGQNCLIGPNIHPIERMSTSAVFYSKSWGVVEHSEKSYFNVKPVVIENDVWVGAYAVIMPGVRVGTGAIIGANSVVTKDIPDYAIAVGTPATVIKYRFDNSTIRKLQSSKWWEKKPEEVLGEYEKFRV